MNGDSGFFYNNNLSIHIDGIKIFSYQSYTAFYIICIHLLILSMTLLFCWSVNSYKYDVNIRQSIIQLIRKEQIFVYLLLKIKYEINLECLIYINNFTQTFLINRVIFLIPLIYQSQIYIKYCKLRKKYNIYKILSIMDNIQPSQPQQAHPHNLLQNMLSFKFFLLKSLKIKNLIIK